MCDPHAGPLRKWHRPCVYYSMSIENLSMRVTLHPQIYKGIPCVEVAINGARYMVSLTDAQFQKMHDDIEKMWKIRHPELEWEPELADFCSRILDERFRP